MKTEPARKRGMFFFTAAVALLFIPGVCPAEENNMMEQERMMEQEKMMKQDNKRMGIPPGVNPIHKTYIPVTGDFKSIRITDIKEKDHYMARQQELLKRRYDLSDRPSEVMMSAGRKPVQKGVRVKLPEGTTWEELAVMSPEMIREKGLFPKGFLPPAPLQARNRRAGLSGGTHQGNDAIGKKIP